MDIGVLLMIGGLIISICELFVLSWFETIDQWQPLSRKLAGASFLCVTGAFCVLIIHFLQDNFSIFYVFQNSRSELSNVIKLSAVWSGYEGSLLLWAVLVTLFSFYFKIIAQKIKDSEILWYSYASLTIISLFFIWLVLLNSPFIMKAPRFFCHTTSEYPCHSLLSRLPTAEGFGLSPLLQNKWNLIHPLVIFIGYATTIIPFSVAIASLTTQKRIEPQLRRYTDIFMGISWVFFSLGIIIGAYWAYTTLGWGGYWSWDPVETASLIPWLLCTAYFHYRPISSRDAREICLIMGGSFVSVLGAAYITRGGAIVSVHSFFTSETTALLGIALIIACLVVVGAYFRKPTEIQLNFRLWLHNVPTWQKSLHLAGTALVIMGLICTLGVFLPPLLFLLTGRKYALDPGFYVITLAPFVVILFASMIGCHLRSIQNTKKEVIFIIVLSTIALAWRIVLVSDTTMMIGVVVLICIGTVVFFGTIQDFIRAKRPVQRIRVVSRGLIHCGIIIVSLGVFLNITTKTDLDESGVFIAILGEEVPLEHLGITIQIQEVQFIHGDSPFDNEIFVVTRIIDGMRSYIKSVKFSVDPRFLKEEGNPMASAPPIVVHGLLKDIYIVVFEPPTPISPNPTLVPLSVSIIRFISVIWLGAMIFFVGASLALVLQFYRLKDHIRGL